MAREPSSCAEGTLGIYYTGAGRSVYPGVKEVAMKHDPLDREPLDAQPSAMLTLFLSSLALLLGLRVLARILGW